MCHTRGVFYTENYPGDKTNSVHCCCEEREADHFCVRAGAF